MCIGQRVGSFICNDLGLRYVLGTITEIHSAEMVEVEFDTPLTTFSGTTSNRFDVQVAELDFNPTEDI